MVQEANTGWGRPDRGRRYQYTISWPRGFVYYRVAKVATRSMTAWLDGHESLGHTYLQNVALPFDPSHRLYAFSFVRNPWDRLMSCYYDKVVGNKDFGRTLHGVTFEEFLLALRDWNLDRCDRHVRRQTALIPVERLDFLGRFESIADDLLVISDRLSLDASRFPRRNASKRDATLAFTDRTVGLVADLYRSDIERFGYEFPVYLPRV